MYFLQFRNPVRPFKPRMLCAVVLQMSHRPFIAVTTRRTKDSFAIFRSLFVQGRQTVYKTMPSMETLCEVCSFITSSILPHESNISSFSCVCSLQLPSSPHPAPVARSSVERWDMRLHHMGIGGLPLRVHQLIGVEWQHTEPGSCVV